MRRLLLIVAMVAALIVLPGAAFAGQTEAPSAACNTGTMTAHTSVPETTGGGTGIEGHEHIPESEDGECVHEAFA